VQGGGSTAAREEGCAAAGRRAGGRRRSRSGGRGLEFGQGIEKGKVINKKFIFFAVERNHSYHQTFVRNERSLERLTWRCRTMTCSLVVGRKVVVKFRKTNAALPHHDM
jgi:hypothetical protein